MALMLNPDNPDIHASLGVTHYKRGSLNKATEIYKKVLVVGETHLLYYNLALGHEKK